MKRRDFLAIAGLTGLAGCARLEQSRLGQLTPDFEFGKEGPMRFAALSDLHLLDSRSIGIVGRAINTINLDEEMDFVVVLGDLTAHGTLPEMNLANQALARLKVPYYCIPGHTDNAVAVDDPSIFYRRVFKKPQWKMSMGGWVFIGLDTSNGRDPSAPMTEANLVWLDDQLSHVDPGRPIVLFSHHPLAPSTKEGRLENADAVLERFKNFKLRLVASGHYHGNQAEEHEGVLFVTTACCSTNVENMDESDARGYRIFTLDSDQIHHEFIEVPR